MADVFVSYSKMDKAVAEELVAFLAEAGVTCWWDEDLVGGTAYREKIRSAIDSARAGIVIWSKDAARSDFVIDEADLCRQQGKLVSVLAHGFEPASVPLGFRNAHHLPLADGSALLAALRDKGVAGRDVGAYALRAFRARVTGLRKPSSEFSRWKWMLGGAVIGAVAVGATLATSEQKSQSDPLTAIDGIVFVTPPGGREDTVLQTMLMSSLQQGQRQVIVRRITTSFLDDRKHLRDTHTLTKEFALTNHGFNFDIPLEAARTEAIRARGFVAVCWDVALDRASTPRRRGKLFAVRDYEADRDKKIVTNATFEPADIDTTQKISADLKCELSS